MDEESRTVLIMHIYEMVSALRIDLAELSIEVDNLKEELKTISKRLKRLEGEEDEED